MLIKNHEIKGVIFDLDGTLVDSCTVWAEVDRDFFKKRNMDVPSDYSKAIAHMGLDKAAIYTKERFNLPESTDEILEEWKNLSVHRYEKEDMLCNNNLTNHQVVFDGFCRLLDQRAWI